MATYERADYQKVVYTASPLELWHKRLKMYMPKGFLWDKTLEDPTSNMSIFLEALAYLFWDYDKQLAQRTNDLYLAPASPYVDNYYFQFGLDNYMKALPTSQIAKYNVTDLFMYFHTNPTFYGPKITELIKELFGIDCLVTIYDALHFKYSNWLNSYFDFFFNDFDVEERIVLVYCQKGSSFTDRNILSSTFELGQNAYFDNFILDSAESRYAEIRAIIEAIIPINFNILYLGMNEKQ